MKKLLLIPILIMLISCSADEQIVKSEQRTLDGDVSKNYFLELVDSSSTFVGWEQGLGIKVPPYDNGTYRVSYSTTTFGGTVFDVVVTYNCPVFNSAEPDSLGGNDWVVEKALSGIPVGNNGTYNYGDIIAIYTVQGGLPVAEVIKQNFNLSATAYQIGYNPLTQINYNEGLPDTPFMFLPAGTADNYTNRAIARSGKQLIIVHFNPSGAIDPAKVGKNVVVLPLNVTINSTNTSNLGFAVIDESAIAENPTIPPVIQQSQRTRAKGKTSIFLDWSCPYHGNGTTTHYIPHTFTVKRNGNIVYSGQDESEFTDVINGNPQSVTYEITTTVIGLGESVPTTITVTR